MISPCDEIVRSYPTIQTVLPFINYYFCYRSQKNGHGNDYFYKLSIAKRGDCDIDQVTDVVQQYVPNYKLVVNVDTHIMYKLPASRFDKFGDLYSALESQKQYFNMRSIRITNVITRVDVYPTYVLKCTLCTCVLSLHVCRLFKVYTFKRS